MLQKTLYQIYCGSLIVFYIQQVSDTVVFLNIKLSKVRIIGQIVHTFCHYKPGPGISIKHEASIHLSLHHLQGCHHACMHMHILHVASTDRAETKYVLTNLSAWFVLTSAWYLETAR